jgi:hypothetical protein
VRSGFYSRQGQKNDYRIAEKNVRRAHEASVLPVMPKQTPPHLAVHDTPPTVKARDAHVIPQREKDYLHAAKELSPPP